MKISFYLFALPLYLIAVLSCRNSTEENIETVNLSEMEPSAVNISDFTSGMETVVLETGDECLLANISALQFDDDYIYVQDNIFRGIYIFDRKGNYIKKLHKEGRGYGEYLEIDGFNIDRTENLIEVFDKGSGKLLYYDFKTLDFLKSVDIPLYARAFRKVDNVYYFNTNGFSNEINGERTNSYIIAYNPDNEEFVPLFDHLVKEGNMGAFTIAPFSVNEMDRVFYSRAFHEYFYELKDMAAKPVLKVDAGSKGIPERINSASYEEQSRFLDGCEKGYLFFKLAYYDYNRTVIAFADGFRPMRQLLYIKSAGQEVIADRFIADFADRPFKIYVPGICGDTFWYPLYYTDSQSDEIKGYLDSLGISKNDNPVLLMFKMKAPIRFILQKRHVLSH